MLGWRPAVIQPHGGAICEPALTHILCCRQLMKLESWKRAERRQIRAELRQLAKEERQRQQKAVQVRSSRLYEPTTCMPNMASRLAVAVRYSCKPQHGGYVMRMPPISCCVKKVVP
jgi:hypothetical protein